MKRVAIVLCSCALLLPIAARADEILLTNQSGTVTLTNAGIVSAGSNLTDFRYDRTHTPPGQVLGSVSFSTGALISGTLFGGGIFSDMNSSFDVTGSGKYGVPKGAIFTGSFQGPIDWTLLSHTGSNYVFDLSSDLAGMLYTGRTVEGNTVQTIYVNLNQWNQNQQGRIRGGHFISESGYAVPEPDTLVLSATGLLAMVGATRRKLFKA
ncbi:MAG: PEP-CTERM sorting domain-containing protein [Terriglobales bacterium]